MVGADEPPTLSNCPRSSNPRRSPCHAVGRLGDQAFVLADQARQRRRRHADVPVALALEMLPVALLKPTSPPAEAEKLAPLAMVTLPDALEFAIEAGDADPAPSCHMRDDHRNRRRAALARGAAPIG